MRLRFYSIRALTAALGTAILFAGAPARAGAEAGVAVAGSACSDFVGINHDFVWSQPEKVHTLIDRLNETGVRWVRLPIRWSVIQPEPDAPYDFSRIDAVVAPLHEAGFQILAILMSVPRWASGVSAEDVAGGFPDSFMPLDLDEWGRYVRATVVRYQNEIRHWEIWNEQNGVEFFRPMPDAEQYVALLRTANAEIKQRNPAAVTVLGGLQMNGVIANPWSPVKVEHFLQRIYDAGGRGHFDIVNIHPYVLSTDPIDRMTEMVHGTLAVCAANGDRQKPVWITECGAGTVGDPDGALQAALLENTLREMAKIPQVERVFWFTLVDYPTNIVGPESSMGVLRRDLTPKPAFDRLKTLSTQSRKKLIDPESARGPADSANPEPVAADIQEATDLTANPAATEIRAATEAPSASEIPAPAEAPATLPADATSTTTSS